MDMRFLRGFVASVATVATLGCLAVASSAYALDGSAQQGQSATVQAASNSTAETARLIKVNQDISDTVHEVNYSYYNWYKFVVPLRGYVQLNMRNSVTSESPHWDMTLYKENDTRSSIFSWNHDGSKSNESSQKYGLSGGTYYLRINGAEDVAYTLKIIYEQRNDWELEPNNTAGTANSVQPNGTVHGSFDSYYNDDWYKFTLAEDGIIQLKFTNQISDSGSISVRLYKSNDMRNELFNSYYYDCDNFDLTSANHSSLKIGLSKGTYYVDVSSGTYSEYSMTIGFTKADAWEKESNDSSNQADDIAIGKTYTGNITKGYDKDWYRFSLDKKQQIQIQFTSKKQSQNYGSWKIYLYSSSDIDKELTKIENPCSQASSNSKVLTLDKGSYYVQVDSAYPDLEEGSEYSLLVTDPAKSPSVTMYRLYNRYTGEHFYTSDVSERDRLVSVGWSYEGVGWRSGGSVPVYRQYNPYARTGTHNYTADGSENDRLVSVGSGTPVAPSSPVLGSYLRDELALDGADGNLQIDWFDPSRARVTYLWEGVPPWLLHQTSSRRVSGGWDISDRLATYQFRTDNNKAALQELDHYAKSARRLSHS